MTELPKPEIVNIIAIVVIVAVIVCLFVFPSRYIVELSGDIRTSAQDAREAILSGDGEAVIKHTSAMRDRFADEGKTLQLFIEQKYVDELDTLIHSCYYLALIEDYENLIDNLESILSIIQYLLDIETFSIYHLI